MSDKDIVIVSAARTPVGSFNGVFGTVPAHELGAVAIKGALERAKLKPDEVDEVILGQILGAGEGQNPARQAAMKAGVPQEKTAWGLNQLCGSGLRAVALGMQQIANGDADIIVAGGQESMSMAPHAAHLRGGVKMGDAKFVDTMLMDGLIDAFHGYHMGNTAENVAARWQITREDQDRFATASQNKAEAAQKAGRFKDEIVPVTVKGRKGDTVVENDEYIRHGATYDAMTKLRPAFSKDGSVTAANASGINDGGGSAGADDLRQRQEAGPQAARQDRLLGDGRRRSGRDGLRVRSRLRARRWRRPAGRSAISISSKPTRLSPRRPSPSTRISASTPRRSTSMAGRSPSATRSAPPGARVLTTLLYEMGRRDAKKGLATLCIGGGMGIAMCVER